MYYVLKDLYDDRNVYVSSPPSFDDWDEINDGESGAMIDKWPKGQTLDFSEDSPEGMVLTDQITNSFSWLIASKKFKDLLEKLNLENLEFLPINFLDHKGRARKEPYWIVNFTNLISAVNQKQSIFKKGVGGTLKSFKKLVLLDDVEKNGPPLFCLKEQPTMFLFRQDLKEKIEKLGLTGFRFKASHEYLSLDPNE